MRRGRGERGEKVRREQQGRHSGSCSEGKGRLQTNGGVGYFESDERKKGEKRYETGTVEYG